jgi:hypothetical protein
MAQFESIITELKKVIAGLTRNLFVSTHTGDELQILNQVQDDTSALNLTF